MGEREGLEGGGGGGGGGETHNAVVVRVTNRRQLNVGKLLHFQFNVFPFLCQCMCVKE